jgi:phage tail protein X
MLPVTPGSYRVTDGINIELINIHELGDVILTGYGKLDTVKISFLLPARPYPFSYGSEPEGYIGQLKAWAKTGERLRFIVSGTGINVPVIIEDFTRGEEDGTNDVYGELSLREYRDLQAVQVAPKEENSPRNPPEESKPSAEYTVQTGDTLSAICRKYYGDASADTYNRLAAYNGRPNPHIIYTGETVKIPQPLP